MMMPEKAFLRERVVARYRDGRLVKGYTFDFEPGRRQFHIFANRDASDEPTPVRVEDLKAVFCVGDFAGNPAYRERKQFVDGRPTPPGRQVQVTFHDGEVLVGSSPDYRPGSPGFFLVPADPHSNNLKIFVCSAAVRHVKDVTRGGPGARALKAVPSLA
jgi:hypothetical protein